MTIKFSRIPAVPYEWQEYCLCILLHLLLPLLPLAVELLFSQTISDKSLTLAAAMYAITIAISSQNKLFFGVGVVMTILLSVAGGWLHHQGTHLTSFLRLGAFGCIIIVFILHALERYNRHVVDRTPFLCFPTSLEGNRSLEGGGHG